MKSTTLGELGEIQKRSGIAFYHQLYTMLSAALSGGSIGPGCSLPSETALMNRFGVSRNTVRRALGRLEREKRIVRRRGLGSYALRTTGPDISGNSVAEVLHDFLGRKLHSTSRLIHVKSGVTPDFIRRKDPHFGDMSMLVQRCRSYKAEPFLFTTSYIPRYLTTRLNRRQLVRQVVSTALESLGNIPSAAEQVTTAVLADSVVARHLKVEPASALLCIHRLIRDPSGRTIEHQSHLFRPDRFQLPARVVIDRSAQEFAWMDTKPMAMPAGL